MSRGRHRWLRRVARGLALVGAGSALGLLVGEGAFRIAMLAKPSLQNLNPPTLVEDAVTEHALLPGITTRYISPEGEFDNVVRINSHGFHDGEYPRAKPAGTYRIVVVGDSLVEGLHVPWSETFPKLVEARLNGRRAGGPRVEVLNLGISGMSPVLEYLGLRDRYFAFEPDLVVLCFFMNDLSEDQAFRSLVEFDETGRPLRLARTTSRTAFVPFGLKRFVKRHSRLAVFLVNLHHFPGGFARHRIFTEGAPAWTPGEPPGDIFAALREPPSPRGEEAWTFTLGVLRHTATLLRARRVPLVLVVIPAPNQVSEREWARGRQVWRLDGPPSLRPQGVLAEFGRREGVAVLDLLPALREAGEFPLFFPYDGHFTATGHRAAAAAVHAFLTTSVPGAVK